VEEIAGLTINADLVVLSACRTVGGTVVNGEGIQGLTTSFLEAGARAVVATYWPVRDRSIVPLISSFYQGLSLGLSAGDALRQAKLTSLRAGDSPALWAALTLTGDAGVRPRQVIRSNGR
jgi:CHAT domain-containing protein